MFQQRISFCCQRISRRTRIFFVFFCVFCCFLTADNAERRKNFFLVPLLNHYIFLRISAYSVVLTADNAERRKNFFSCPSLEPLYISAHFCVFCGSILSDFMYIFIFVPFVFSVGKPLTMSDVSRAFFVPLTLESSRCRTGW